MNGSSIDTIRAFIAARPSAAAQEELVRIQHEFKKSLALSGLPIKWTDPATFHITILFLGDLPAAETHRVVHCLEKACALMQSVRTSLKGTGLFKKSGALWIGIDAPPELLSLQAAVADALERDPGRFHAHFTVGRIKKDRPDRTFFQTLEKTNIEPVMFDIKELELVKSELLPAGARHTVLSRIPLSSRP